MLIAFGCVLVNVLGRRFAAAVQLPLWLDCLGTVFAGYMLGPLSGAVVGCTCNIIYAFWDTDALIYGVVSILIGFVAGGAARKKWFESFFNTMTLGGVLTIGATMISTVFNLYLYGGSTGNIWGDGVRDFLTERGVAGLWASAAGELYLDFLDKFITVLAVYFLIRLFRGLRSRRSGKRAAAGLIVLLLFAGPLAAPASALDENTVDPSYIQQVYNADNGLPGGHANDIVQTNEGILWVGTSSGLYRYTGSSFRLMDSFASVKNVNCLYVDQEGRLWIGTNDNGLVLSIREKVSNTLDITSGLPSDSVTGIVQSADGDYYVGTTDRMAVVRITIGIAVAGTVDTVRGVRCVSADSIGNVAAVTERGSLCVLREQKLLYEIPKADGSAVFSTCTFHESGLLYAGTEDGGILTYRVGADGAELLQSLRCEGASTVNRICFHEGNAWILAENGVWVQSQDSFRRLGTEGFDSSVRRMAVDYQGHFWFASSTLGLLQLSETSFPNLNMKYGLPAEPVHTTAVRAGVLYIGTDKGLSAVELQSGLPAQDALTEALAGVAVNCIVCDSGGELWVCTAGKGLLSVSPDGEIREHPVGSTAYLCTQLKDGAMAAVSERGLSLIRAEEAPVFLPCGDELGTSRILSVFEQPDGSLLLGTDGNGILVVKDGLVTDRLTKENGLTSGVVRRIVPDDSSDLLFLVTGNSLCCMDQGQIRPIPYFPYSDNYDLVVDNGAVFVPGSAGIYVVRKDALLSGGRFDYALLDFKAGFEGAPMKNAWNAMTGSRDLYLSTDRGVIRMNLGSYWSEKRSYRLMVSEIKLDGRSVPIERGSGLTIGREVGSIEFVPEIVNYSLEDPKVSYYLEGIDSGYKTVAQSELTGVVYRNLPSGDYTFHIAIIDEDTGTVREESTYSFTKEKSIHDNSWFVVYLLLVGGLFVGWLTWFITRVSVQQTIAIQQERLALALKQVQMGNETILAIAKTVDAKDVLTSKHSQRVSEYSVLIAKKLGLSAAEQENLRKAALLHDIGKIGIPDSILNKPARLTESEYAVMKTHVTSGAEILKDFTLIDHVVEGTRYHHERYDGQGYPDGLSSRDIPLYGRIIAIADAFDAMTANRVYRNRMDFPDVMNELRKGRGTQFDPELLDLFLEVIESGEIDVDALYAKPSADSGEELADV